MKRKKLLSYGAFGSAVKSKRLQSVDFTYGMSNWARIEISLCIILLAMLCGLIIIVNKEV